MSAAVIFVIQSKTCFVESCFQLFTKMLECCWKVNRWKWWSMKLKLKKNSRKMFLQFVNSDRAYSMDRAD